MENLFYHYILEVLMVVAFTCGLKLVSSDGMLLEKFGKYVNREKYVSNNFGTYQTYAMNKWIRKPLLGCIYCMPSLWGTIIFWSTTLSYTKFGWYMLPLWVVVVFSSSYFNLHAAKSVFKWQEENKA